MDKKLAKCANLTPIKTSDGARICLPRWPEAVSVDDWYLGYKETGFKDIDAVNKQVTAAKGLIRLTVYAGHLNKSDKKAAQKLGGKLMPRLKEIQNELNGITEELNKVDMNQYAGMDAVKAGARGRHHRTGSGNPRWFGRTGGHRPRRGRRYRRGRRCHEPSEGRNQRGQGCR